MAKRFESAVRRSAGKLAGLSAARLGGEGILNRPKPMIVVSSRACMRPVRSGNSCSQAKQVSREQRRSEQPISYPSNDGAGLAAQTCRSSCVT